MTIQTTNDAIVAKGKDLDILLWKSERTMDDVQAIKALGEELKTLKSQLSDLETAEDLRKQRAAEKAAPVATNDVTTTVVVKGSRIDALQPEQKSQYIAGRFLQAAMKGSESAKQELKEIGVEFKTHTESVDATGGVLVPNEVSNYKIQVKEH